MSRAIMGLALAVGLIGGAAFGQAGAKPEAAPGGEPGTVAKRIPGNPAAASTDKKANVASPGDTPQQALRKLLTAIEAGDAAAVRTYMLIDPSNEPAFADNFGAILASQGRLKRTIGEKLGADAIRQWEKDNAEEEKRFPMDAMLKEIDTAKASRAEGGGMEVGPLDKARTGFQYPSNYIHLRQVDRVWKVDLKDWTGLPPGDKRKRFSADTLGAVDQGIGDTFNRISDQIEQGKIKTWDEVSHALRQLWGMEKGPDSSPPPPTPKS